MSRIFENSISRATPGDGFGGADGFGAGAFFGFMPTALRSRSPSDRFGLGSSVFGAGVGRGVGAGVGAGFFSVVGVIPTAFLMLLATFLKKLRRATYGLPLPVPSTTRAILRTRQQVEFVKEPIDEALQGRRVATSPALPHVLEMLLPLSDVCSTSDVCTVGGARRSRAWLISCSDHPSSRATPTTC
jgi:hypothetical protein